MSLVLYLLKVNLAIIVCWAVFRVLFRQLTFFRWNRYYLLGSVILSLLLPLLHLPLRIQVAGAMDMYRFDWTYVDHLTDTSVVVSTADPVLSIGNMLLALYITITVLVLGLSVYRFGKLLEITRNARRVSNGPARIFVQDIRAGSFTVFKHIYLDRHTYENRTSHVIRHERVHAAQLHSVDLLIMELVGVFLWFNPFVFLLKRYVRENHEYLADDHARKGNNSLREYLTCMRAETIRHYSPVIASYFQSSTMKKRIIMLTNQYSNRYSKWRYLILLPVVAFLMLAFQTPEVHNSVGSDPLIAMQTVASHSHFKTDGIPSIFPLPEKHRTDITWGFAKKAIHPITRKETIHHGVDIKAPEGTAVYATADGTVQKAEESEGWGNMVVLKHAEGYETVYAHLHDYRVQTGATVRKGETIGSVGNTGQSTGNHLHYEILREGENMDPADYY